MTDTYDLLLVLIAFVVAYWIMRPKPPKRHNSAKVSIYREEVSQ